MAVFPSHWWCGTLPLMGVYAVQPANLSRALRHDRKIATEHWRSGCGLLWFQHLRRAGGTSLCNLLHAALAHARFVEERSEACQPEEWKLRDAYAVMGHNLTLLEIELRMLGGNAFAQEYGPIPTQALLQRRMPRWVFVTHVREPWSRFWSQLRHEMAPCLMNVQALALCLGNQHGQIGMWWSPSSHVDSVLGVSGFRISKSPRIYSDNYYLRVLLNRTDPDGPDLTEKDYEVAKSILFNRMSAVIVTEDFAKSALQLACALGLNLEKARSLLRTRVRPYQHHEAMLEMATESELGLEVVRSLQIDFAKKNRFDYGLYREAKRVSAIQVAGCAKSESAVAELKAASAANIEVKAQDPVAGENVGVDAMFGCNNGSVQFIDGNYVLICPRTIEQRKHSWWTPFGAPKRRAGQKPPGEHCWTQGFQWAFCCDETYGPEGNPECWDNNRYTYSSCCTTSSE